MTILKTNNRYIFVYIYHHLHNEFSWHVSKRYAQGERIVGIRLFKAEIEISMKNIF